MATQVTNHKASASTPTESFSSAPTKPPSPPSTQTTMSSASSEQQPGHNDSFCTKIRNCVSRFFKSLCDCLARFFGRQPTSQPETTTTTSSSKTNPNTKQDEDSASVTVTQSQSSSSANASLSPSSKSSQSTGNNIEIDKQLALSLQQEELEKAPRGRPLVPGNLTTANNDEQLRLAQQQFLLEAEANQLEIAKQESRLTAGVELVDTPDVNDLSPEQKAARQVAIEADRALRKIQDLESVVLGYSDRVNALHTKNTPFAETLALYKEIQNLYLTPLIPKEQEDQLKLLFKQTQERLLGLLTAQLEIDAKNEKINVEQENIEALRTALANQGVINNDALDGAVKNLSQPTKEQLLSALAKILNKAALAKTTLSQPFSKWPGTPENRTAAIQQLLDTPSAEPQITPLPLAVNMQEELEQAGIEIVNDGAVENKDDEVSSSSDDEG